MAILSKREGLQFDSPIKNDTAALNEFATPSNTGIEIEQSKIKVDPAVSGACEFLGLDPLYVANEGKLIAIVSEDNAQKALDIIRKDQLGTCAEIIGEVTDQNPGMVTMKTTIGGQRIVDMLVGEQLPRIC